MPNGFELSSGAGSESVAWEIRARGRGADGPVLTCDVTLAGSYHAGALASGDRRRDFHVVLLGLELRERELERAVGSIEAWLAATGPPGPLALACSMGGLFDQSLHLELGPRDDTLSGGMPVATLRFIVGRLTGEMIFATDRSCLRELARGIRASALGA